jgi:hypothetical protein
MDKISWTDGLKNEEVLRRLRKERNILRTINSRKANWIGHILRGNRLLKHGTEGKIRGISDGKKRKKSSAAIDDFKEKRGCWKLKKDAKIALCGEVVLEEAMDLSQDRLRDE